jgi:hypothetical protein
VLHFDHRSLGLLAAAFDEACACVEADRGECSEDDETTLAGAVTRAYRQSNRCSREALVMAALVAFYGDRESSKALRSLPEIRQMSRRA